MGFHRGRRQPVLARLLHDIRPGETLVVVRLDRLARSVSHLLEVIEQLEAAGAHFRSLHDPIDTTTARHVLAAGAGRRRPSRTALIAERTKPGCGLRAAVVSPRQLRCGTSGQRPVFSDNLHPECIQTTIRLQPG
jgi:hypothetical protein